jgi:hypothetical protein
MPPTLLTQAAFVGVLLVAIRCRWRSAKQYIAGVDCSVDREGIFSVKYDLRSILFGSGAASATPMW